MIKVIYNKVCGRCVQSEPLTSGMVGQPIHFEYSHDFDGLAATAVFTDGKNTVNVVNPGNECIIPHEVLTTVGAMVKVGIYAVRGDELVIPTVYATIGIVLKGADPNGGISEDPTLPVRAQTQAMIGNLNALETEAKENLVVAVNEVKNTTDSKQDAISDLEAIRTGAAKGATALQSVPNTYRTAAAQDVIDNGLSDRVSAIERKEAGWNSKYSKPTGGIPKADLANDVQASLGKADTALQEHQSLAAYRTAEAQDIIDNGKQDKLIAGENITIAADGKTISATGGGGSVPKPLTYDYMPEGYPTKTMGTVTMLEEQEVAFTSGNPCNYAVLTTTVFNDIIEGQTYTVKWDGTEYECVAFTLDGTTGLGNLSIIGAGADTGEPFLCGLGESDDLDYRSDAFYTLDTSPSHTISVKTTGETAIPMSEEFIPQMNVSAFTNDAGYLTLATLPKYEGVVV